MPAITSNTTAALLPLMLLGLPGCDERTTAEKQKTSAAQVQHVVSEGKLATITLSSEALGRLGIETAPVTRKRVRQTRLRGGEVIVPPGRSIIVSAPMVGRLSVPESVETIMPGARVTKGQEIFRLSPVLAPNHDILTPGERFSLAKAQADLAAARAEAEGRIATAKAQLDAAVIHVRRADRLREQNVGSVEVADDAHAELELSRAALQAAQAHYEVLKSTSLEPNPGAAASLVLHAPIDGILQSVQASAGQVVAAGAALFQVDSVHPLWVRVPVYVGDLDTLDLDVQARVTELSGRGESHRLTKQSATSPRIARHVSAPPTSNPNTATVGIFFEVANDDHPLHATRRTPHQNAERSPLTRGAAMPLLNANAFAASQGSSRVKGQHLQPGQRVGMRLTLRGDAERPVVPWSAVRYDIHGHTWIYEALGAGVFARRGVSVHHVASGEAVLDRGPAPGTEIVTVGVAELFGIEFGIGK